MAQGKDIRIIFWGTPEFAIPPFKALLKGGYSVIAVVTNPDEPVGRKQILTHPPVKVVAQKYNLSILQPKILKANDFFLKEFRGLAPHICIVAAYGKIIPKEILEIPPLGFLNIHPSLLPRWRGPSPIQYTILNGDTEAGVTIIKMDELMDHGPIVAMSKVKFQVSDVSYKKLHDELAKLGGELLIDTLPKWIRGEITPVPQDDSKATYSKILKKDDGRINWRKPAEEIERMIRAFSPWPGTWTLWPSSNVCAPPRLLQHNYAESASRPAPVFGEATIDSRKEIVVPVCENKIYRIRVEEADVVDLEFLHGSPGYVWQTDEHKLLVKTGRRSIGIKKLTLEGKKSVSAEEFLRGHPQIIGSTFV